ncbi:hypothetical protein BD324DRAFT_74660 [Kockovaella imperatae]|uniref:Uncharacterized protein n=1 Tax=Kockovaella imperatae TaxID=4999 RepID=A0A1Y1UCG1_9TREE|nr:hypothetical protein BD324DRAFT_74660 [Kockovaella imperatae]ORX35738.1 hypothetical protein BD324DRAFT_74660 [Kockovaella imperatae]
MLLAICGILLSTAWIGVTTPPTIWRSDSMMHRSEDSLEAPNVLIHKAFHDDQCLINSHCFQARDESVWATNTRYTANVFTCVTCPTMIPTIPTMNQMMCTTLQVPVKSPRLPAILMIILLYGFLDLQHWTSYDHGQPGTSTTEIRTNESPKTHPSKPHLPGHNLPLDLASSRRHRLTTVPARS